MKKILFVEASLHYCAGRYSEAYNLYHKAGVEFGMDLVSHNLELCKLKMGNIDPEIIESEYSKSFLKELKELKIGLQKAKIEVDSRFVEIKLLTELLESRER